MASPIRDLRRHQPTGSQQRARCGPRQRLVPWATGLVGSVRAVRRRARRVRAAGGHLRRRLYASHRHGSELDGRPERGGRERPVRRRDHRRPSPRRLLATAGIRRRDLGWRSRAGLRHGDPHAKSRPRRRALERAAGEGNHDVAVREDARGFRPESGRLGACHGSGTGGNGDLRPARGSSRAWRTRHSAAAHGSRNRQIRPQRRPGRIRAHVYLPRLPVRRDIGLAGGAEAGGPHRCRDRLRAQAHRNVPYL